MSKCKMFLHKLMRSKLWPQDEGQDLGHGEEKILFWRDIFWRCWLDSFEMLQLQRRRNAILSRQCAMMHSVHVQEFRFSLTQRSVLMDFYLVGKQPKKKQASCVKGVRRGREYFPAQLPHHDKANLPAALQEVTNPDSSFRCFPGVR